MTTGFLEVRENQNKHFMFSNLRQILPLMR